MDVIGLMHCIMIGLQDGNYLCESFVRDGLFPEGICQNLYHCGPDCCDIVTHYRLWNGEDIGLCHHAAEWVWSVEKRDNCVQSVLIGEYDWRGGLRLYETE